MLNRSAGACGRSLACAAVVLLVFGGCFARPRQARTPAEARVVILGVSHSAQLVAESYQPAVFRAFFERVNPDAICIERSPQEFARNDFYEFTYEQQYLTVPYAREHHIPLHPVDWLPSADDTLLAFGIENLETPLVVRRPSGFLGFLNFTEKEDLATDLFYSEAQADRDQQREFATAVPEQARADFARRLYLYRTFMQAMRITRVARENPGKTVLVVIGSLHKNDIEQILRDDPGVEIVQPSVFGRPDPASVAQAVTREDLFAVATFNLLGVQSKTGNMDWEWLKRVGAMLGGEPRSAETLLLETRLRVLTGALDAHAALDRYTRAFEMAEPDARFTWTGVKDRSRVDSYFDPFGNLSVKQRAQLEMAREHVKLGETARAGDVRRQLEGQLSTTKAMQLDAYWDDYVVHMP